MNEAEQKLCDLAWSKGGDYLGELYAAAESHESAGRFETAAVLFKNSALAYKHDAFRESAESFEGSVTVLEEAQRIYLRWLNERREEIVSSWPVDIPGMTVHRLASLISTALVEPSLQTELNYLQRRSNRNIKSFLGEVLTKYFGLLDAPWYAELRDPEFRVAIDPIIEFILKRY